MKILKTIIIAILLTVPSIMSAQNSEFEKASKLPGVQYSYISRSMLSQLSEGDNTDGITGLSFLKQLDSVETLVTKNEESMSATFDLLDEEAKKMEKLTQVVDDGTNIDIYGIKKGESFSKLLLVIDNKKSDPCLVAVFMTGEIDINNIKEIIQTNNSKTN